MSKKTKDTDYLLISAYLRAQEPKMLGSEKIDRMLAAKSAEDAAKILEECGFGAFETVSASALEEKIASRRAYYMAELVKMCPDIRVVDAFRVRYDYHNAKTLVKSGGSVSPLLSSAGRIPPEKLAEAFRDDRFSGFPKVFSDAIREARDTLARTGDPQLADFLLDCAYFEEFMQLARDSGSKFLIGYAELCADCANLKTAVRAVRMGKDETFYSRAFVLPGTVSVESIVRRLAAGEGVASLFEGTLLAEAAKAGDEALAGDRMTCFERECDNAVVAYLKKAKLVGFGEQVVISFICALENELSGARIVFTGRLNGLSEQVIRERLRESYV